MGVVAPVLKYRSLKPRVPMILAKLIPGQARRTTRQTWDPQLRLGFVGRDRSEPFQKVKCAASWRVRDGVPPDCSELITPKFGLPNCVFGLPNEAWLKTLRASSRNSRLWPSNTGTFLISEASEVTRHGPRLNVRGAFPNVYLGLAEKALVLNHSPTFATRERHCEDRWDFR
jgi:hypothetical protein